MKSHRIVAVTISLFAIFGSLPTAKAATIEDVMARLNTLEKANAALAKDRMAEVTYWSLLVSALSGFSGALVGVFLTHRFAIQRDREQRRREFVLTYMIEAWRNLDLGSRTDTEIKIRGPMLEKAIADIQLLGGASQITLANQISKEFSSKGTSNTTNLLNELRDGLRKELKLPAAPMKLFFLRITPRK
jgi:ABC-type spermidine/putrescine transport system permease subunit I